LPFEEAGGQQAALCRRVAMQPWQYLGQYPVPQYPQIRNILFRYLVPIFPSFQACGHPSVIWLCYCAASMEENQDARKISPFARTFAIAHAAS
jgi:hypothetical protein